jgi:putative endonuclease
LYTGVAKDLPARIAAHNDGRGAKYTRPRLPVKLVYSEAAADRAAAQRREHAIKRLPRAAKRALCRQLMTEKRRPSGRIIAFKK